MTKDFHKSFPAQGFKWRIHILTIICCFNRTNEIHIVVVHRGIMSD